MRQNRDLETHIAVVQAKIDKARAFERRGPMEMEKIESKIRKIDEEIARLKAENERLRGK